MDDLQAEFSGLYEEVQNKKDVMMERMDEGMLAQCYLTNITCHTTVRKDLKLSVDSVKVS